MASRTDKLHRLVDVLQALETLERAKVSDLTRRIEQAETAQREILDSLAEPTPLHGRFVGLLSRRIGSLERRLHGLGIERDTALAKYCDAMARGRAAESMFAKSKSKDARADEQKHLEGLLQFFDQGAQGRGKSKAST